MEIRAHRDDGPSGGRRPGDSRREPLRTPLAVRLAGAAAAALCALLIAPAAPAQPAPTAATAGPPKSAAQTAADKRAAQKLLAQGNQLLGEGDYVGALDKFRIAYEKFPSPKLLLNVGTTLRQLGRNVEAAEVYEKYLRDPEHDASREKEVQRVLEEIDAVVGRIVITVDDPAASVRLDGKVIEGFVNGQSRRVEVGDHQVTAVKAGVAPVVQNIVVRGHQEYHLALQFAPPPPKPPEPGGGTQRTLALAFGGVGVLSLGIGIISGIVAVVQNGDAATHCYKGGVACGPDGVEQGRAAKTSAAVSTIGFSAGLGFIGIGALIYFLAPPGSGPKLPFGSAVSSQRPSRVAAVNPWFSVSPLPSGAAVSFGGAF